MYITSSWKINLHKTSEWQWKKQPFEHVSPIKRGDFSNVIVVFRTEACHPQLPASDIYSNIFTVYRVQLHHFFETDLYNQFVSFLKRNFAFFFFTFHCFRRFIGSSFLGSPHNADQLASCTFLTSAQRWPWRLPGCISHMKSLLHPITLKLCANKFVWYMKNVFFSKNNFYILEVWLKKCWTCIHVGNTAVLLASNWATREFQRKSSLWRFWAVQTNQST